MSAGVRVTVEDFARPIMCRTGETFLEAAARAGLALASACGADGRCRSCAVRVLTGPHPDVTDGDAEVFSDAQLASGWRRACRMVPRADISVHVPRRSLIANARHLVSGQGFARLPVDPMIRSQAVRWPPADAPAGGIAEHLLQAIGQPAARIDIEVLRTLSAADSRQRAFLRDEEVIGVGAHTSRALGVAVDLGTTNIAAFLIDLKTGATLGAITAPNPQARFGGDVVTRLTRAIRDPGDRRALRDLVVGGLDGVIRDLCANAMTSPAQVMDLVIAGNTAMHHLFAGLPVAQLGKAPFRPATVRGLDIKARDLGLSVAPGAHVHLPGIIAGYVGSDHVAALLACAETPSDGLTLLVDIGTNTEISLIAERRILSASCPSGPALEGGQIGCGMPAAPGAISALRIDGAALELTTIDDAPAIGLCGSGVLDVVAQLLSCGAMDARGRLDPAHPRVVSHGAGREFILVADGPDGPIGFSQDDIRAVQLAKAAIRAGIDLLLKTRARTETEIRRVLVAGAFGSHVDLTSAIAIGLLPDLPPERFRQIGNAAGDGARLALTSARHRSAAQRLARDAGYLELAGREDFMRVFVGRINFTAPESVLKTMGTGS